MDAQPFLTTARLIITPLTTADDTFILELLNTEGWIKFIGNRNVTSREDATGYIQKITENKNTSYWVVKLVDGGDKIGIITFIQRDYLPHPDIGFAFLPHFSGKGYAYEAAAAVLNKLIHEHRLSYIYATTVPGNISSINLLRKVGLSFEKQIEVKEETLHLYGASTANLIT